MINDSWIDEKRNSVDQNLKESCVSHADSKIETPNRRKRRLEMELENPRSMHGVANNELDIALLQLSWN